MDLAKIGQIAGIAGIAVGAVVLIFRSLIEKGLKGVSPRDRGRTVIIIAVLAFGVGLAGIGAWAFAGAQGRNAANTIGCDSPAAVGGRDVIIGSPLPPRAVDVPAAGSSSTLPAAPPAGSRVETRGDRSPAAIGGRDVTIGVQPAPSAPSLC